ncbi:hypothetical protein MBLNU230_g8125t1 [Neophaeotheca triangularis]
MTLPATRDGFEIGILCALKLESDAVEALMQDNEREYGKASRDRNAYRTGLLGSKPVVLAYPQGMGARYAGSVAGDMRFSFPNIKLFLVVGVAGGAHRTPGGTAIHLGDVLISTAVIASDFGRQYSDGLHRKKEIDNALAPEIRQFLRKMEGVMGSNKLTAKTIEDMVGRIAMPDVDSDRLFSANHRHKHHALTQCSTGRCGECHGWDDPVCDEARRLDCEMLGCAVDHRQRRRPARRLTEIHFGRIASANNVLKSERDRDRLMADEGVIGFEMEGAGTWDHMPTVIVKSVCDYADSHKNKLWQNFSAATAASCAKALLQEWVLSPPQVSTSDVTSLRYKCIPLAQNLQFVGQQHMLDELKRRLFEKQECRQIAIEGLGGMGKTQVALRFAYWVFDNHADFSVFWAPALSTETFDQAYGQIAAVLGVAGLLNDKSNVKQEVKQRLTAGGAGKFLLVVDNADDVGMVDHIRPFLPKGEYGLTIFTTRDKKSAQKLAGNHILSLKKMSESTALRVLSKTLDRDLTPKEHDEASALLTELDYLPLAITQAAAYMRVNYTSISEYHALLSGTEEDKVLLMSEEEMHDHTRYDESDHAVFKTLLLSFKQLEKENTIAAQLMGFMCCIEWRSIPRSLLPKQGGNVKMNSAIGLLCAYSFITKGEDGAIFDMHRLVHSAARNWLAVNGKMKSTQKCATEHVLAVFPTDEWENRETWRSYIPHAARINTIGQNDCAMTKGKLCEEVGRCLMVDGRFGDAVRWLESASNYKTALPEDHPSRLSSQFGLVAAYGRDGRNDKALLILENVAAIRSLAEDHPARLASQHELARAYMENGWNDKAVLIFENVVAIRSRMLAEDHPERLALQHCLAIAYSENGWNEKAVSILENVVTIWSRVLAEDHPDRLASQHALAVTYRRNGWNEKAVPILENVVTIRSRVLAEDHPDRLASQRELAIVYRRNGWNEKAVPILENVVTIRSRVLAEDHPDRLDSQYWLAVAYFDAGQQLGKAKELMEHVVAVRKRVLAEDHPNRVASESWLTRMYDARVVSEEARRATMASAPSNPRALSQMSNRG